MKSFRLFGSRLVLPKKWINNSFAQSLLRVQYWVYPGTYCLQEIAVHLHSQSDTDKSSTLLPPTWLSYVTKQTATDQNGSTVPLNSE